MLVSVRDVTAGEYAAFSDAYAAAATALEDRQRRLEAAYALLEHSMTCIGHGPSYTSLASGPARLRFIRSRTLVALLRVAGPAMRRYRGTWPTDVTEGCDRGM
jgi:hypothetical protein